MCMPMDKLFRGAFRTLSNICNGTSFLREPLTIFAKKLHGRCLSGFEIRLYFPIKICQRRYLLLSCMTLHKRYTLLAHLFPMHTFSKPLKTSENRTVFWCFQGIEKGCIGYKWVDLLTLQQINDLVSVW